MPTQKKQIPVHTARATHRTLPAHELAARSHRRRLAGPPKQQPHPRPATPAGRKTVIYPASA